MFSRSRGSTPYSRAAIACALALAGPIILAGTACSSAQPSQQLVAARTAYDQASQGPASRYAPDELLAARNLLQDAESAETGSEEEKHLAYLADRQARFAASQGALESNQARLEAANRRYVVLQEQGRVAAERGLSEAQRDLTQTERQLSEAERRAAAQQAELERARARADAAMASLEELGNLKAEGDFTTLTLSGAVLFKTGEASLLPLAENRLAQVADALQELDESQQIVIEGHTDSRGAAEMNQELSQRRAETVMNYLIEQGVDRDQLSAQGRGEFEPIAKNDTPEGRANNRRVEIVIENPKPPAMEVEETEETIEMKP